MHRLLWIIDIFEITHKPAIFTGVLARDKRCQLPCLKLHAQGAQVSADLQIFKSRQIKTEF